MFYITYFELNKKNLTPVKRNKAKRNKVRYASMQHNDHFPVGGLVIILLF